MLRSLNDLWRARKILMLRVHRGRLINNDNEPFWLTWAQYIMGIISIYLWCEQSLQCSVDLRLQLNFSGQKKRKSKLSRKEANMTYIFAIIISLSRLLRVLHFILLNKMNLLGIKHNGSISIKCMWWKHKQKRAWRIWFLMVCFYPYHYLEI